MLKQYLETGEIVGTHGIKGEARVHPWSDTPDFLCGFKTFYLDDEGKGNLKVKSSRVHGNMVLIKFILMKMECYIYGFLKIHQLEVE